MSAEFLGYEATVVSKSRDWVFLAEDLVVPDAFTVRVQIEGEPWTAEVEARVGADKRAEPWSVRVEPVDGGPMPAEMLRKVRLGEAVRIATQAVTEKVEWKKGSGPQIADTLHYDDVRRSGEIARRAPRSRVVADLERVAETWHANPEAPTRAVEESEHVSRATATRLIARARKAGLIPPTDVGRTEDR